MSNSTTAGIANNSTVTGTNDEDIASITTLSLAALCLFGVVGNILAACVLAKLQESLPGVRLLKWLSIVDIITVILLFLDQILSKFRQRIVYRIQYGLFCITYPTGLTIYTFEIYLTVLIAIQRAFASAKPLIYPIYFKDSTINKVLLALFIASVAFNVQYWLRFDRFIYWDEDLNTFWLGWNITDNNYFIDNNDGYLTIIVRAIIPLVILSVCNVIVITVYVKRPSFASSRRTNTEQLALINVAIVTMSVLTHLCSAVTRLAGRPEEFPELTPLLIVVNSSTNVIFYSVLGRSFRHALRNICKKPKPKRRYVI